MSYAMNSRKVLWRAITAFINRREMWLIASMFLLSLAASVVWAQDEPLEAAIPQRCASKYPDRVRQIRAKENQANLDREEIRRARSEVGTRERQAEANENIAKGLDERAKLAREKNDLAQARGFETDAAAYRDERDKLRREAAPYQRKVESLERSVAGQQASIDSLVRELLTACGIKIDQGGGNQGGGNQGGGNQGGGNQGGGNQGGGNPGGGNTATPIRINLPNGGYRLLHRDQKGLVFKVEEFDNKGLSQSMSVVNKFSPEGHILESTSVSFGYPGRDKHKEIHRTEKYDENGFLVETNEDGSYWDKSRHTKSTKFKDFGGKYGYNTKVVTEDGQTKTYVRDENGNWVLKEDKKPEPPKADPQKPKPPKQDPKPEQNKQEDQGDMRCLAGKWRSNAFSAESGSTGGLGLVLTIKANGEATADYSERTKVELIDVFTKEVTQTTQYSGVGSATIKAENNRITIVRRGPPAIKVVTYHRGQKLESTQSGLGVLLQQTGTFTCGDRTLTIKSEVETYTFNRIR